MTQRTGSVGKGWVSVQGAECYIPS
jgi:hypothetical protein